MAEKKDLKYVEAVGRRKSAVARVRLYLLPKNKKVTLTGEKIKKGEVYVNKKPIAQYFPGETAKKKYQLPFKLTEAQDRFATTVLVKGGGRSGQLDAVMHGLSRALQLADKSLRPVLKKNKLLTRDARMKERRKPGTGGKARRKKKSPKR